MYCDYEKLIRHADQKTFQLSKRTENNGMTITEQRNLGPSVPQPQTLAPNKVCIQLHATMDQTKAFW